MKTNKRHVLCAAIALALCGGNALADNFTKPEDAHKFPPIAKDVPQTPFDAPAGTWTLAVLPDTQHYSMYHPDVYMRQTEWLVKNKSQHNILFVLHEGDIVTRDNDTQWTVARKAMDILNRGRLPYALTTGNHDYNMKKPGRFTLMNNYFKEADYKQNEKYGLFEKNHMENSWHALTTPWGKFLILALEFGPRDEVLAWADKVTAGFPDHRVIIVTHAHIFSDDTRYDWAKYGVKQTWNPKSYPYAKTTSVNDGEDVWNKLISKHGNMRFVLNGHVCNDGAGYNAAKLPDGKTVHQILANYQGGVTPDYGYGGGGYMRLMQFLPDGKTVRVRTYSPLYDKWLTTPEQQFDLTVD